MTVDYDFKKGIDHPTWDMLTYFPQGLSYHGCSNVYDGVRYIYWVAQTSVTTTAVGTTTLWRYCTWTDSWHYLSAITSGNRGIDVEHDPVRNVLYILHGAALTSWQVFNLNTTAVTVANVVCQPFVATTMTPVLPLAADYGASFTFPNDRDVSAPVAEGEASAGSTSTVLYDTVNERTASFQSGMVGLQVRFTSGALAGERRIVLSIQSASQLTVSAAFSGAPAVGDTYVIEMPTGTATAGTTTTLTDSSSANPWVVNQYANHDVLITAGTGAGQRRRVASNTASVLTLAAAVAGNADTGPFSVAPDATSQYQVVPSDDFLYYQPGSTSANFYRIDLSQTTGVAWSALAAVPGAPGSGGNTMYPAQMAPSSIFCVRGAATSNVYQYNIGLNTWASLTFYGLANTITTGGSAAMMHGRRRILLHQDATVRLLVANLATGTVEAAGTIPYANPGAYDGKRLRFVRTPDGVEWVYVLRAGGQEYFRMAVEWLD